MWLPFTYDYVGKIVTSVHPRCEGRPMCFKLAISLLLYVLYLARAPPLLALVYGANPSRFMIVCLYFPIYFQTAVLELC